MKRSCMRAQTGKLALSQARCAEKRDFCVIHHSRLTVSQPVPVKWPSFPHLILYRVSLLIGYKEMPHKLFNRTQLRAKLESDKRVFFVSVFS